MRGVKVGRKKGEDKVVSLAVFETKKKASVTPA